MDKRSANHCNLAGLGWGDVFNGRFGLRGQGRAPPLIHEIVDVVCQRLSGLDGLDGVWFRRRDLEPCPDVDPEPVLQAGDRFVVVTASGSRIVVGRSVPAQATCVRARCGECFVVQERLAYLPASRPAAAHDSLAAKRAWRGCLQPHREGKGAREEG